MKPKHMMARMARWHIWLAWLAGVPILMWTLTGLIMVARPIDEVRGSDRRIAAEPQPLPQQLTGRAAEGARAVTEMRAIMQRGRPVMLLTRADGETERLDMASGKILPPLSAQSASEIVREQILGGDQIRAVRLFPADSPPSDFRREQAVWQVSLEDGTHVYVGQQDGEIAAIRTPFWRVFDFAWGLHIMDLQTREDTHHPVLIVFAVLAASVSLIGVVLMFRKRRGFIRRRPKPSK